MRTLLRFAPLISRLRSRLGGNADYKVHASRSWVIHPEETNTIPPALFDPDDLHRISAYGPGEGGEVEMQRIRGGPGSHTATTAYELSDVVLSRGHAFTARAHYAIAGKRAPMFPQRPTREFGHAVMASTSMGYRYFGHWMADDLPMLIAARDIGEPISIARTWTPAQTGYAELLGLKTDALEDAYFKKLVVIDDVGQNTYKRTRFRQLRELAIRYALPSAPKGVMLLRGIGGSARVLSNEAEVASLARSRGFNVLDPALTDASELLRACFGASVVLGVEGSQLTNGMLWMSQHGTMVTIQPPDRFVMVLKNRCDCIGIRSAFVVGKAEAAGAFRVDIDALGRMLDAVAA